MGKTAIRHLEHSQMLSRSDSRGALSEVIVLLDRVVSVSLGIETERHVYQAIAMSGMG